MKKKPRWYYLLEDLKKFGPLTLDIQPDGTEIWSIAKLGHITQPRTVQALIRRNLLVEAGDCLPGGKSQTWNVA